MVKKIILCGHGEHGKTTFCKIAQLNGYKYVDASTVCLNQIIWPLWGVHRYNSRAECFNDRRNHRDTWRKLIKSVEDIDSTRLIKEVFKVSDIYDGLRNPHVLDAACREGLVNTVVWVGAEGRMSTRTVYSDRVISPASCTNIITNNGTLLEFERKVMRLLHEINI